MLVYAVIKLGHKITYGNCEAVNTTKQSFRTTRPYYYIEFIDFFILSYSHHIKFTYLKYVFYIYYFFYLFSTLIFFLHCMLKTMGQVKKLLYIWWIDYCTTRPINWCDSKYNIKSIFLFLESVLEKTVFGPLVFRLVLSHSA